MIDPNELFQSAIDSKSLLLLQPIEVLSFTLLETANRVRSSFDIVTQKLFFPHI